MAGKSVKLDIGTVYKKDDDGPYFFRYQLNGQRKAVSLKTKNQQEAIAKAKDFVPVVKSTTMDLISAHVKHARGLAAPRKTLALADAWEVYSRHPDRATPATAHERESYRTTFEEFVKAVAPEATTIADVTPQVTDNFARYLLGTDLSVATHNRKIKRLRKIFTALQDYRNGENPFTAKSLFRKPREEQENGVRRLSFTREQEESLLEVLADTRHKVKNKPEMRVVYHLGMFTGQRFKDCILLRWDKVDLNRHRIWVKQFKTGKEVTIPIAPRLFEVLQGAQAWKRNDYVCPNLAERYSQLDGRGRNTGNNLANIDALRVIKWIGLEPSVSVKGRKRKVTVYGFHSLRHSFASHCAEAGVPKAVVLSILGTGSEIVDKYYTHIGDEAQEKAIMAINGMSGGVSPQERIDRVLAFIDSRPDKSPDIQEVERLLR